MTAERQAFREHIRMQAAELFALGHDNAAVAKQLRVSARSVQRWHQAWEHGGASALESKGPASRPKLREALFEVLEQELAKGPVAHGWPDQTWTLARIKTLIGRRFHKSMTLSAIAQMLHRHGFSHQVPARRAVERNEEAVTGWVKETWPQVETPWRRSGPGSSSSCAVRRCVSCGGERPCATRRCDPRAGVRPAPSFRRSGTTEAGGSWTWRVGRVWWRAAPTTTGRTGTTGRCGSGKRDGKVDARNQRCKAPQDLRQLNPVDLGWIAVRTARTGRNSWIGLILPVGRPR